MRRAFLAEPVLEHLLTFRHEASRHPAHVDLPPLRDFRRNVPGAGNNRSQVLCCRRLVFFFRCLPDFAHRDIHEQFFRQLACIGRNPSRWYDVPVLPIDKSNGKPKCQGKRHQACATAPRPDWAFGCIKGRRREEALAIVENNMFRCRRSKRNHAIFFRDVANAFPSLSHEPIARHVRSQGAAHDLIMDAHANALACECRDVACENGAWHVEHGRVTRSLVTSSWMFTTFRSRRPAVGSAGVRGRPVRGYQRASSRHAG